MNINVSESITVSESIGRNLTLSLRGKGVLGNLKFRGVDTMKKNKDTLASQPTDTDIDNLNTIIVNSFNVSHISISPIFNTDAEITAEGGSTPSPRTVFDFTAKLMDSIHALGKKVIYRGAISGWEMSGASGLYGLPLKVGANRYTMGTVASAPTDGSSTFYGMVYAWIVSFASHWEHGDIFAPFPERTENNTQQRTITSLTRSGSTATATFSGNHDIADGEPIKVSGATQSEYNGQFVATKLSDSSLSYTVSGTPTTPATGSPVTNHGVSPYDDAFTFYPASGSGLTVDYANFFIDIHAVADAAFRSIKKNVYTGWTGNNWSELSTGWIPSSLFSDAKAASFDHYGVTHTSSEMGTDLDNTYSAKGQPMFHQEWGDYWSGTTYDAARLAYLRDMYATMGTRVDNGKTFAFNYWGGWNGGSGEQLFSNTAGTYGLLMTANALQEAFNGSPSEIINVYEYAEAYIYYPVNEQENITVSENISVSLTGGGGGGTLSISVSDSITLTENVNVTQVYNISIPYLFHYQDFNSNALPSGWTVYGGSWSYSGGKAVNTVNATDPSHILYTTDVGANRLVQAAITLDTYDAANTRFGIGIHVKSSDSHGVNLMFRNGTTNLSFLDDLVAWGPTGVSKSWATGQTWIFKAMYVNGTYYGKAWDASGSEPNGWDLTWVRTQASGAVYSGITGTSSGSGGQTSYDNFYLMGLPESVTVSDTESETLVLNTSVNDSVSLTESTGFLETSFINKNENVTVSELVNLSGLSTNLTIQVSENISVSDVDNQQMISSISVSDNVTLTESVNPTQVLNVIVQGGTVDQQQLSANVGAGFGEFAVVRYRGQGFTPTVSPLTAISFARNVGGQGIKVYIDSADTSWIPDHAVGSELYSFEIPNGSLSASLTKYTLPVPLTVTPGNRYVFYLAPWNTSSHTYQDDYQDMQSQNSNVYADGNAVVFSSGAWSASDLGLLDHQFQTFGGLGETVTVSESINELDILNINVSDSITVSESITVSTSGIVTYNISVSDSISISESIGYQMISYISKSDNITITDTPSMFESGATLSADKDSTNVNRWDPGIKLISFG